jgi:hypothetical protein
MSRTLHAITWPGAAALGILALVVAVVDTIEAGGKGIEAAAALLHMPGDD